MAKMVNHLVLARLNTGWRFFSLRKGWRERAWGGGAHWHFWCSTATERKCFANPTNRAPSLPGGGVMRVKGEARTVCPWEVRRPTRQELSMTQDQIGSGKLQRLAL